RVLRRRRPVRRGRRHRPGRAVAAAGRAVRRRRAGARRGGRRPGPSRFPVTARRPTAAPNVGVGVGRWKGRRDQMRTHYVGDVSLDPARLDADIDRARTLAWSEAYSDYVFGGSWKSLMLWAPG